MDFSEFVNYISSEYRLRLFSQDYEYLQTIFDTYSIEEIKTAVDSLKTKNVDSLRYLLKVLAENRRNNANVIEPAWLNKKYEKGIMTKEEIKEMEDLMKEFRGEEK